MRMQVVLPLVLASAVGAEETWRAMSGAEIAAALTDKRVQYEAAWQHFYASGRTLYNAGQDSWGYWRIEEDQYCSQWPPSGLWECYRVEQAGDAVQFVGQAGDTTIGVYINE